MCFYYAYWICLMYVSTLRNVTVKAAHSQRISCFSRGFLWRQFSSLSGPAEASTKFRRLYAVGGCMVFMWLSTHGFLFYRRQREHHYLNKKIPSISWEDFVEYYLMRGMVKTVIYQPQYETGNAFLHPSSEKFPRKTWQNKTYFATGKVPRVPDVRFSFNGKGTDVQKALLDLQNASTDSSNPLKAVEFEIDEFPSNWEMAFIAISTFLTLAAIALAK